MIVLTRQPGEGIRVGRNVVVTVERVEGQGVRLRVEAPEAFPVYPEEIFEAMTRTNRDALIAEALTPLVIALFSRSVERSSARAGISHG